MSLTLRFTIGLALPALGISVALAEETKKTAQTHLYRDATFEDLAQLNISSLSKSEEKLFRAAADVTVISDEDIRRSGALTLPDVLRMAPGMEVGQINSRSYSVTMRGFSGSSANKILPLIDGRSLYSARFGGTIWDIRDVPLEDVQQIETIGGPGGTTWGTNAVNGVVNIITKDARQTQGSQISVGGGNYEKAFIYAREGMTLGPGQWLRVYAKAFARDSTEPVSGGRDPNDAWEQYRAGFRYDQEKSPGTKTLITGDIFTSRADQIVSGKTAEATSNGGHLLGRREITLGSDDKLSLQAYYDRINRDSGGNLSTADVGEVEVRHEFELGQHQRLTWGANTRLSKLDDAVVSPTSVSSFSPSIRYLKQGALFLQDVVAITPQTWTFTGGMKAEYNDFTDLEFLPSARLAWTPNDRLTLWSGYSRAVRIPSRFEYDQTLESVGFVPASRTLPNRAIQAETLDAFEAGLRHRPNSWLNTSASVYLNQYDKLATSEILPSSTFVRTDSSYQNKAHAHALGSELSATLEPTHNCRLIFTWSLLDLDIDKDPDSTDATLPRIAELSPKQQLGLRSRWNIDKTWEVDAWWRWVDDLQGTRPVPAYNTLDLRVGKQLGRGWEVSVVARNLLEPSHPEFNFSPLRSEIPRSIYIRFDWLR